MAFKSTPAHFTMFITFPNKKSESQQIYVKKTRWWLNAHQDTTSHGSTIELHATKTFSFSRTHSRAFFISNWVQGALHCNVRLVLADKALRKGQADAMQLVAKQGEESSLKSPTVSRTLWSWDSNLCLRWTELLRGNSSSEDSYFFR